ncbi:hypothetical protein [Ramlibacter tataouinensis]|uniref:Uncharacterized protein n=1 Tax=Ramlibacter tataouinensis (strain ATCC BAA-407 / DSM 14655 / LMG 21543 / TTB310) TaxID=365046 RepID=F5XVX6_RAMTT|nr:hypothetical protein [Ramlibacter tataouinensis]AEG94079.1 hypothetical protein Rta_29750 [Ramlibacter tataouinensis TTB310]
MFAFALAYSRGRAPGARIQRTVMAPARRDAAMPKLPIPPATFYALKEYAKLKAVEVAVGGATSTRKASSAIGLLARTATTVASGATRPSQAPRVGLRSLAGAMAGSTASRETASRARSGESSHGSTAQTPGPVKQTLGVQRATMAEAPARQAQADAASLQAQARDGSEGSRVAHTESVTAQASRMRAFVARRAGPSPEALLVHDSIMNTIQTLRERNRQMSQLLHEMPLDTQRQQDSATGLTARDRSPYDATVPDVGPRAAAAYKALELEPGAHWREVFSVGQQPLSAALKGAVEQKQQELEDRFRDDGDVSDAVLNILSEARAACQAELDHPPGQEAPTAGGDQSLRQADGGKSVAEEASDTQPQPNSAVQRWLEQMSTDAKASDATTQTGTHAGSQSRS